MKLPWSALNPMARKALFCHALYWQAMVMAFTFINVYLFRLGQGYRDPAWFQIWSNGTMTVGFALGSWLARRRGSAASFRAGILTLELVLVVVLLLRERCRDFLPFIGFLNGLGTGFYWLGWILLMVDLTGDGDRDAMLSSQQWVFFVAGLTGAPLAGWFLASFSDLQGYSYVFIFSTLLFAAAWWISRGIQSPALHGGGSLMRILKVRKPTGFWRMNFSAMLMGLMSVSSTFLTGLVAFESKGNESGTGSATFVSAALGFVGGWWMARYGNSKNRLSILLWSATAVAVMTLPLAFHRSFALVLLYSSGMAVTLAFYNMPLFAAHLGVLSSSRRLHLRRADALTLRETFVIVGRVLGFAFIMVGVGNIDSMALGVFLVAVALTPLLNIWVMRRYV